MKEIVPELECSQVAVLEGQWLGQDHNHAIVGTRAVSTIEGEVEAFEAFPKWLSWHAQKYPSGAAIGYLAYELAALVESINLPKFEFLPSLSFSYYSRLDKLSCLNAPTTSSIQPQVDGVQTNFSEDSYLRAVTRIHNYLSAGHIYQANLTQQFKVSLTGQRPEHIYHRLAQGGAPFRAFLKTPRHTIVSNSPERFFRVNGNRILCSPIKGTTTREADCRTDRSRVAALLSSTKDRAENVMIVDLVRNDLGRICSFGSIHARLFDVVELPHLFHLVSHVEGTLRPDVGPTDIFRALFPCGSVTGAPKVRAMEILSEIEQAPRGISMGALGAIVGAPGHSHFEMDFNVAIRTLIVHDGIGVFNVGGGIVYDSKAESEYEEMLLKAQPLFTALGFNKPAPQQVEFAKLA